MKKRLTMVAVLFVMTIMLLQPYSINFKALANQGNNDSKEVTEDCLPCKQPQSLKKDKVEKFNDNKIIKTVKKEIKSLSKQSLSEYHVSDLAWNESVISYYKENTPSAISIPLKNNVKSKTVKEYVVVGYKEDTKELHQPTFMKLVKNSDKEFTMIVGTLDGEEVVEAVINTETQQAEKVEFKDDSTTALIQKNTAAAGYWDDVKRCIKNNWKSFPDWAKFACEAACGGCLFASPYACGACLGCLGGYAIGCSIPK